MAGQPRLIRRRQTVAELLALEAVDAPVSVTD
jgi:hypothetical protein